MGWRTFYDRVTEGMALADLWSQFKAETRTTYKLYSREIDWKELDKTPKWRRFFRLFWALFLSMLMSLSPARRVLLLASMLLVFIGKNGDPSSNLSASFYGGLGLLLLLGLELADRVIMKRDLEIAREIQQWLVPEEPPQVAGADVAFATKPANTVGGDYYDVILHGSQENAEESLLLVVADVAGKSVPAALLMATFQASLRAMLAADPDLSELVQNLNSYTCSRSRDGRRFTTAFLAEYDVKSGSMVYVNAGHNYPILKKRRGEVTRLESGGIPFGIRRSERYELGATSLQKGDFLLIFTDGVTEAVNEDGEEYGEARLLDSLQHVTAENARASLHKLMADLDQFVGQERQHDDMTWLVVSVPG